MDAGDFIGYIEEWRDRLDATWHATTIPMPAEIHARALAEVVERIRDEMTALLDMEGK